jgi:hypothetical protein
MDDLSYYLGRLVCSVGLHSCEDTEALLSVGHIAFWVLLALIGIGAWRFRTR